MFSAVHPITDFAKILRHFRFVPNSEVAPLFNHLVGAGEQRRRKFEAQRLRGLEIDF
jgi:hypothetical protein